MERTDVTKRRTPAQALWLMALVALLGLGVSGCEFLGLGGSSNTKAPPKKSKPAGGGGAKDGPAGPSAKEEEDEVEYERPEYPNQTRRNPFLPDMEVIQPQEELAEGQLRPLEPLEKYAIGQLTLAAIISETAVPKAMFLDPKGFGHVVKEGDRVGQNGGKITDIRDNEVEVREVTDEEETQTRLTTVELRSRELKTEQDDDGLSDEEREALRRLLQSEDARKTARQELSGKGRQGGQGGQQQGGGRTDSRFGDLAPPE